MPNPTPDSESHDSHVPLISNRNEVDEPGVSTDMSTTEEESRQPTADSGNASRSLQQEEESLQQSAKKTADSQQPTAEKTAVSEEVDSSRLTVDSSQLEDVDSEEVDSSQFTVDSEEEVDSSQLTVDSEEVDSEEVDSSQSEDEASSLADDDTGEIEAVEGPHTESLETESVQTVQFDYDDYYAEPETGRRPEPVSERIDATPEKERRSGVPFFLGALAAGVLGAALTLGVLAATGTFDQEQAPPIPVANAAEASVDAPEPVVTNQIINEIGSSVNPTAVALKVVPSIVTITVFEDGTGDEEGLFGVGSGSGVVVSDEGYILTNHHVIDGASDYRVEFEDGRVYTAELVGSDDLTDIAVLQISADDLTAIDLGSSDELSLGDPAIAVGNPLGQEGGASVSVGIVSAFDRRVDFAQDDFLHGMIQTDAAINSGSSGGALVNAEGQLIGITSAIGVSQAGPEGIGYAIPVELVKRIADEIIETGDVIHPFLGVTIGTFLDEAPDGATVPSGSDIQSIEGTDSAAGAGGLEAGDIIVRIGDDEILGQTDLILAVRLYRVGDEVEFEVLRDGELQTFAVVMGQRPTEFGG